MFNIGNDGDGEQGAYATRFLYEANELLSRTVLKANTLEELATMAPDGRHPEVIDEVGCGGWI
jgi:hypothetical protein